MLCEAIPAGIVAGTEPVPDEGAGEAVGRPARGGPPGSLGLAARCGAKTRAGGACQAPAMANGRCRIHGGTSTGPRTAAGLARLAASHTTSGAYSAANWAMDRYKRTLRIRTLLLGAARQLQAYMPPEVAAQVALVPAELWAPALPWQTAEPEFATKTLWTGARDAPGRDVRGRFTARPRPALRGRAAELAAARAEQVALAPWRAVIAAARLAEREARAARRAAPATARVEKRDKDPMERLPGGCLGARRCPDRTAGSCAPSPARDFGPLRGPGSQGEAESPLACRCPDGDGGAGAADGGCGIGKSVQRPYGTGAGAGPGEAGAGGSTLTLAASRLDLSREERARCAVGGGRSPPATSENGDKDPVDKPPAGLRPGGHAVRWPFGGLKGRLCATTTVGGQPWEGTRPGSWQAVLEAWNAEVARKSWTVLGGTPPGKAPRGPPSGERHL